MAAPELLQRISPSGPLFPNSSLVSARQFERVRTNWEVGEQIGPQILQAGTVIPMVGDVRIGQLSGSTSRIMLDWFLPILLSVWDGVPLLSALAEISGDEGANWVPLTPTLDEQAWPESVETAGEPSTFNNQRVNWFGSYVAGGLPASIYQAPTVIARVTLSTDSAGPAATMIAEKGSGFMTLAELSQGVPAP